MLLHHLIAAMAECIPNGSVTPDGANCCSGTATYQGSSLTCAVNTGLDKFNPLIIDQSAKASQFSTPGGIITEVLVYAFPIAGMILFLMILWGGFEMLAGASSSKGQEAGKNRITAAVIGFFLLFVSYWLAKLVGVIFGISIL